MSNRPAAARQSRMPTAVALVLCGMVACGCDRSAAPAPPVDGPPSSDTVTNATVTFDTATVTFITGDRRVSLNVEIAEREDQRAFGLMDRDALPHDAGMIFLYDEIQPAGSSFWMYRTRIPLDIAFFDGAGRIVAIEQMTPCTSLAAAQCPPYSPGVPFFGAVEANRGFLARNGIGTGDAIVLPGRIGG